MNNNLIIDIERERTVVNLDQVRVHTFRNYNESSQISNDDSQLPRSRSSFITFSFLSQSKPRVNFNPLKLFDARNAPQSSSPAHSNLNRDGDQRIYKAFIWKKKMISGHFNQRNMKRHANLVL